MASKYSKPADWRSTLHSYVESTEGNLKSLRNSSNSKIPTADFSRPVKTPPAKHPGDSLRQSDTLNSARNELGSLLSAVQGSLAELRVEVAAAKRLSSSATAAVAEVHTPQHSVSPRPPSASRTRESSVRGSKSYASSSTPKRASVTRISAGGLSYSDQDVSQEDVINVLDKKISDLGRKLEKQLDSARGRPADPMLILSMTKAESAEKLSTELKAEMMVIERQFLKATDDIDRKLANILDTNRQHWDRICQVASQLDSMAGMKSEVQQDVRKLDSKIQDIETIHKRISADMDEQHQLLVALTSAVQQAQRELEFTRAEQALQKAQASVEPKPYVGLNSKIEQTQATLTEAKSQVTELALRLSKQDDLAKQVEESMSRLHAMEAKLAAEAYTDKLLGLDKKVEELDKLVLMIKPEVSSVPNLENRVKLLESTAANPPPIQLPLDMQQRIAALEEKMSASSAPLLQTPAQRSKAVGFIEEEEEGEDGTVEDSEVQQEAVTGLPPTSAPLPEFFKNWLGVADVPVPKPSSDSLQERGFAATKKMQTLKIREGTEQYHKKGAPSGPAAAGGGAPVASPAPSILPELNSRFAELESKLRGLEYSQPMLTLRRRIERLEEMVYERGEMSMEESAQEARLAVAEEFASEALKSVKDTLEPAVEEITKQLAEIREQSRTVEAAVAPEDLSEIHNRIEDISKRLHEQQAVGSPGTSQQLAAFNERLTSACQRLEALENIGTERTEPPDELKTRMDLFALQLNEALTKYAPTTPTPQPSFREHSVSEIESPTHGTVEVSAAVGHLQEALSQQSQLVSEMQMEIAALGRRATDDVIAAQLMDLEARLSSIESRSRGSRDSPAEQEVTTAELYARVEQHSQTMAALKLDMLALKEDIAAGDSPNSKQEHMAKLIHEVQTRCDSLENAVQELRTADAFSEESQQQEVTEKLVQLETELDSFRTQVGTLETSLFVTVNAADATAATALRKADEAMEKVTLLVAKTANRTELESLQVEVSNLLQSYESVRTEVEALSLKTARADRSLEQIHELERSVAELSNRIDEIDQPVKLSVSQVEEAVATLSLRLTEVKQQVDNTAAASLAAEELQRASPSVLVEPTENVSEKLAVLELVTTTLSSDLGVLKAQALATDQNLDDRIGALQKDLDTVQDELELLKERVDSVQAECGEIANDLDSVHKASAETAASVDNQNQAVTNSLQSFQTRLAAVELASVARQAAMAGAILEADEFTGAEALTPSGMTAHDNLLYDEDAHSVHSTEHAPIVPLGSLRDFPALSESASVKDKAKYFDHLSSASGTPKTSQPPSQRSSAGGTQLEESSSIKSPLVVAGLSSSTRNPFFNDPQQAEHEEDQEDDDLDLDRLAPPLAAAATLGTVVAMHGVEESKGNITHNDVSEQEEIFNTETAVPRSLLVPPTDSLDFFVATTSPKVSPKVSPKPGVSAVEQSSTGFPPIAGVVQPKTAAQGYSHEWSEDEIDDDDYLNISSFGQKTAVQSRDMVPEENTGASSTVIKDPELTEYGLLEGIEDSSEDDLSGRSTESSDVEEAVQPNEISNLSGKSGNPFLSSDELEQTGAVPALSDTVMPVPITPVHTVPPPLPPATTIESAGTVIASEEVLQAEAPRSIGLVSAAETQALAVSGTLDAEVSDESSEEPEDDLITEEELLEQQRAIHSKYGSMGYHDSDDDFVLETTSAAPAAAAAVAAAATAVTPAAIAAEQQLMQSVASTQSMQQSTISENMSPFEYRITIETADKKYAGTKSTVFLTINGTKAATEHQLNDENHPGFEQGSTQAFIVDAGEELGEVKSIQIWHTGEGMGSSWLLSRVIIDHPCSGSWWEFNCDERILGGERNSKELFPQSSEVSSPSGRAPVEPPKPSNVDITASLRAISGLDSDDFGFSDSGLTPREPPLERIDDEHDQFGLSGGLSDVGEDYGLSDELVGHSQAPATNVGTLSDDGADKEEEPVATRSAVAATGSMTRLTSPFADEEFELSEGSNQTTPSGSSRGGWSPGGKAGLDVDNDDEGVGSALVGVASDVAEGEGSNTDSLYQPTSKLTPKRRQSSAEGTGVTRNKRVSFAEFYEEHEFDATDGDDSSVMSFTEEQLLEAQASSDLTYEAPINYGYCDVLISDSPLQDSGDASASVVSRQQSIDLVKSPKRIEKEQRFEDVPLIHRKQAGIEYKLKVFTADRLNGGLGNTTVFIEILGTSSVIEQTLPKVKGAFQRGSIDRFSLWSEMGDIGQVVGVKVWHQGNTLGSSAWCLEKVEVENRLKGLRYMFFNNENEGWVPKGRNNAVILKPIVARIDDTEELLEVQKEYEVQLQNNKNLSDSDREVLKAKLGVLGKSFKGLGRFMTDLRM